MKKLLIGILCSVLWSCAAVSAQEIIPPTTLNQEAEVVGWEGDFQLQNGDWLNIYMIIRPSVTVILETGTEVYLCIAGGEVKDKDTYALMQSQISSMCWFSFRNYRWEAAFVWFRWSPSGLIIERALTTGSFNLETGMFQQDGGEAFQLTRFE